MLSVSDKYLQEISSSSRYMVHRVTINGTLLSQGSVTNISFTESISDNNGISVGTANSASLNLTIRDAEPMDYNGLLVKPESGLTLPDGTIEWIPLGEFWVTNFDTSNDFRTLKLTCADGMYNLTGEYESELEYPTTIEAVVNELVAKSGVKFIAPSSYPDVIVRRKPPKMSFRNAFGHAAGCCGKNARFNRNGKLEFVWYNDTGMSIERKMQYLDGMTKLGNKTLVVNFKVKGEVEKYTVNVITDNNGYVAATPSSNVLEGDTVTLSVGANNGYELAILTAKIANGNEVTLTKNGEGGYTFVQPDSDVTVTASFRQNANGPFTISTATDGNGTIATSKTTANAGETVTITINPNDNYSFKKFITTPATLNITEKGTNTYTFTVPASDVTITAYFNNSTTYTIERTADYQGRDYTSGYIDNNSPIIYDCAPTVYSLRSNMIGVENVEVEYSNPFIYEKAVDAVQSVMQSMAYTPVKLKHRGNPAFQAGDIVTVPDGDGIYHKVLIMSQTMTFGGGMNCTLTCPGQTAQTASFNSESSLSSAIEQKLNNATSALENKIGNNNSQALTAIYKSMTSTQKVINEDINQIVDKQTTIEANVNGISTKVSETISDLENLEGRVSSAETSIEQNANDIKLKASNVELNALGERVSTAESSITQNANNIALKVSKDGVMSAIEQSPETIKIKANRVDIDNLFSQDITMTGTFTTTKQMYLMPTPYEYEAVKSHIKLNSSSSSPIYTIIPEDEIFAYDIDGDGDIDEYEETWFKNAAFCRNALSTNEMEHIFPDLTDGRTYPNGSSSGKSSVTFTISLNDPNSIITIEGINIWGTPVIRQFGVGNPFAGPGGYYDKWELDNLLDESSDIIDAIQKDITNLKVLTGNISIDDALSPTSTNPVQNKVVKEALDAKLDKKLIINYTEDDIQALWDKVFNS